MTNTVQRRMPLISDCVPLFALARKRGLWFFCPSHDLWFSPDDLEREQRAGTFRWSAMNWTLRDPQEYVDAAIEKVKAAEQELARVKARVYRNGQ